MAISLWFKKLLMGGAILVKNFTFSQISTNYIWIDSESNGDSESKFFFGKFLLPEALGLVFWKTVFWSLGGRPHMHWTNPLLDKSFFGQIYFWTNPLLDKSFFGQMVVGFMQQIHLIALSEKWPKWSNVCSASVSDNR